jgi:hypothetical protein
LRTSAKSSTSTNSADPFVPLPPARTWLVLAHAGERLHHQLRAIAHQDHEPEPIAFRHIDGLVKPIRSTRNPAISQSLEQSEQP